MTFATKIISKLQPYDYSKKDAYKFIANRILGSTSLGGIIDLSFPISKYINNMVRTKEEQIISVGSGNNIFVNQLIDKVGGIYYRIFIDKDTYNSQPKSIKFDYTKKKYPFSSPNKKIYNQIQQITLPGWSYNYSTKQIEYFKHFKDKQ